MPSTVHSGPPAGTRTTKPHKVPLRKLCSKPHRLEALEQAYPRRDDDSGLGVPVADDSGPRPERHDVDQVTSGDGPGREGNRARIRDQLQDLCMERTDALRAVGEAALAHAMGNSTEQAYARSDLFEKRRALMEHAHGTVAGLRRVVNRAGPLRRVPGSRSGRSHRNLLINDNYFCR